MKDTNHTMRDRDFAACCVEAASRARFNNERLTASELIARAMAMQPQCYYVSPGYAHTKIKAIGSIGAARYSTMASEPVDMMWLELYERVVSEMEESQSRCLFKAVVRVIGRRPSRFYISPRRAYEIFNRAVRAEKIFVPRKSS